MAVETPTSGTQDVLDAMVASVMGRKAAAKTKLTPVGLEVTPTAYAQIAALPNNQVAAFPNDHPNEVVENAIREIRRQIRTIEEALDTVVGILRLGPVDAPTADPIAEQKAKERAADEKAAERTAILQAAEAAVIEKYPVEAAVAAVLANIDAKTVEAQAVTFRATEEPVVAPEPSVAPVGWSSPNQGKPLDQIPEDKSEAISPSGGAWVCPVHGTSIVMTSRKGRKYLACPQGDDFEKLA